MKKHNYFDDDDELIDSIRQRVKTQEALEPPKRSARQCESEQTEPDYPRYDEKAELKDAIKAFSHQSGEKIIHVARAALTKNPIEEFEKLNDNKKRLVTIGMTFVFLLFFVLLVFFTVHSVNSESGRIAKFDSDAGKVCSQYIAKYGNCNYENLYYKYDIRGFRMTGLCYVRQVDFNNDGVSELLMVYDESGVYYIEVWGYKDKKFSSLYREKATQTKKTEDAWVTVYTRNNKYYIGVHSGDNLENVKLYTLRGEKFESRYTCSFDSQAQTFAFDDEVDPVSFERIKLAVLREEKANVIVNQVTRTIEDFSYDASKSAASPDGAVSLNNAYYDVIEEYNQKYGTAKYVEKNGVAYIDGLAYVDLVDFDGDDKDELVVIYRKNVKVRSEDRNGNYISNDVAKYHIEIYRYNGNKAILAYQNESISNSLNDTNDAYYIIKSKNGKSYYCLNTFSTSEHGRVINASSTIFNFNKTSFEPLLKAAYVSNYGYADYYIDDKEVYKSTFNDKGYSVPLFNGEENYDDSQFTVTFLQRKLTKAKNMQSIVTKTEDNIRMLNSSYSAE